MLKCRLKEIRLKEFMEDNKSSFAKKLGVPLQTYKGWEDEKSFPKLEQAFMIAKKINRDISYIWYLEN